MGWINLLDIVYPVGSIYISVVDKSPAEIVGGTWTGLYNTSTLRNYVPSRAVEGQAPLGDWDGTNYITVDQLPAHSHKMPANILIYDAATDNTIPRTNGYFRYAGKSVTTQSTGGGERFLGVHTSVRMWKRTA